jgi:deoxyribonuclease (pyrimidine dimer)
MTRINADLDPAILKRAHLLAELREITMVPASLKRSLRTIPSKKVLGSIPKEFCLNKGHVKFFYDKLEFLQKRFDKLADEMERRGYKPDRKRKESFKGFDVIWYGDWNANNKANEIVLERINLRISQKPHLYKD